jgi:CheY-like chemotaxis protein
MARVLVVDDDDFNRRLIGRILEKAGHEVIAAAGGREALELVASSGPAIVLLDYVMPDLDGPMVARAIRAAGRTLPILMLTSAGAAEHVAACLAAGVDGYMTKPVDARTLPDRVRALLGPR